MVEGTDDDQMDVDIGPLWTQRPTDVPWAIGFAGSAMLIGFLSLLQGQLLGMCLLAVPRRRVVAWTRDGRRHTLEVTDSRYVKAPRGAPDLVDAACAELEAWRQAGTG